MPVQIGRRLTRTKSDGREAELRSSAAETRLGAVRELLGPAMNHDNVVQIVIGRNLEELELDLRRGTCRGHVESHDSIREGRGLRRAEEHGSVPRNPPPISRASVVHQVEGQAVVLTSDGGDVLLDAAEAAGRAKERAEIAAVRGSRVNAREARIADLRPATESSCFKTAIGDEVTRNSCTEA